MAIVEQNLIVNTCLPHQTRFLNGHQTSQNLSHTPGKMHSTDEIFLKDNLKALETKSVDNVWRAALPSKLHPDSVVPILTTKLHDRRVISALTGPDIGFQAARAWKRGSNERPRSLLCGNRVITDKWIEIPSSKTFGTSVSLYDTNPLTSRKSGDPIADAFMVKMRPHSCFIAIADGVNWGEASMQAARCAINAVYEFLEGNLFLGGPAAEKIRTTKDAANLLFEAFKQAQIDIVAQTTGLTTLCVGLLLPVHQAKRFHEKSTQNLDKSNSTCSDDCGNINNSSDCNKDRFALVVASVGDSQAYLIKENSGAIEVTGWIDESSKADNFRACTSEDQPVRDFRNAGGALGAVYDSEEPELGNLMCSVTFCGPRDMLLFGTDGLTDNLDPVVSKIAVPLSPEIAFVDDIDSDSDEDIDNRKKLTNGSESTGKDSFFDSYITPFKITQKFQSPSRLPSSSALTIPIWPKAPPPPPKGNSFDENKYNKEQFSVIDNSKTPKLSACDLNLTNKLELSYWERKQHIAQEITHILRELDGQNFKSTGNSKVSAADFGEALLRCLSQRTEQKRKFLEAPETTKLKAQFSRYFRKKNYATERINKNEDSFDSEFHALELKRQWILDILKSLPGKLDHCTIVTVEI